MVITMAKLRMAHASTHGACKPPGPKEEEEEERLNDGENNGQATHGARKHAWRTQAGWAKSYLGRILSLFSYIGSNIKIVLHTVSYFVISLHSIYTN